MEEMSADVVVQLVRFLDLKTLGSLSATSRAIEQVCRQPKFKTDALERDFVRARQEALDAQPKRIRRVGIQYTALPQFSRLFFLETEMPNTQSAWERRVVCSRALQRIIRKGQREEWGDLASLAQMSAMLAIRFGMNEIVEMVLYARETLEIESASESESSSASEEEIEQPKVEGDEEDHSFSASLTLDHDVRYPTGDGELLLGKDDVARLMRESILEGNDECVKLILEAESETGADESRIDLAKLKEAISCCADTGRTGQFGRLLPALVKMDPSAVDGTISTAFTQSAASGNAEFAANLARMLEARHTRRESQLAEKEAAGQLEGDELTAAREALAYTASMMEASAKNALIGAAKGGYLRVVEALLATPLLRRLPQQDFKLALRAAAMNGHSEVTALLATHPAVASGAILDLFEEAVRRGYEASVRALLPLRVVDKRALTHYKREAFNREQEEIVLAIDAAFDDAPEALHAAPATKGE